MIVVDKVNFSSPVLFDLLDPTLTVSFLTEMATSLPSDEVAGDYKEALEDLITNDRFQIANLTMIAKENIEHAEAIARVLALHIKKVRS